MSKVSIPVSVRFVGKGINEENGVPIYELAETLTAVQRLMYRAYLEHENLSQRTIRSAEIRRKLALQIGSRERGSDIYNLVWFLQTPGGVFAMTFLTSLLTEVSLMGVKYSVNQVIRKWGKKKPRPELETEAIHGNPWDRREDHDRGKYVINKQAIPYYNEFSELTNPVGRAEGVERIEISFGSGSKPLIITPQVRENIRALEDYYYYGESQDILGVVDRANVYKRDGVVLRIVRRVIRGEGKGLYRLTDKKVFVHISRRGVFQTLMKVLARKNRQVLSFHGRPIHRVGDIGFHFRQFESDGFVLAAKLMGSVEEAVRVKKRVATIR